MKRAYWLRAVIGAAALAVAILLSGNVMPLIAAATGEGASPRLLATRYHARNRTANFYQRAKSTRKADVVYSKKSLPRRW